MIKFKQFILENPSITHSYEYEYDEREPRHGAFKHHSTTSSGHEVRHMTLGARKVYHFYKPGSKIPDIRIGGTQHGDKFIESSLGKSEKSTIKAHEAYKHLVDHGLHIHSDTIHSPAGASTWKKLSQHSGIKVQSYNTDTNKYGPVADAHNKGNMRLAVSKA